MNINHPSSVYFALIRAVQEPKPEQNEVYAFEITRVFSAPTGCLRWFLVRMPRAWAAKCGVTKFESSFRISLVDECFMHAGQQVACIYGDMQAFPNYYDKVLWTNSDWTYASMGEGGAVYFSWAGGMMWQIFMFGKRCDLRSRRGQTCTDIGDVTIF